MTILCCTKLINKLQKEKDIECIIDYETIRTYINTNLEELDLKGMHFDMTEMTKQFQEMNEAKEMFEKEKRKLQNEMKRMEDEKDKLGPIL